MHNLDIIKHAHTPIGTIYLGKREKIGAPGMVHEIMIDGALLMSNVSPVSERRLSSSALKLHKGRNNLSVLIGGLGLGHTAEAALEDERVSSVCVVEKMDFVINWMKDGVLPLSTQFSESDRMHIEQGDIYDDLLGPVQRTYDLILVDVDHSPDDPLSSASAPFYTKEGQERVAKHLNPGGVLAIWSAHDHDEFAEVLSNVYPCTQREDVRWQDEEIKLLPYHNVLFLARVAEG